MSASTAASSPSPTPSPASSCLLRAGRPARGAPRCSIPHSPVFTPVADGITTLNVDLPVGEDASPDDDPDYLDEVGLSILEDGVTIPLVDDTALPLGNQPLGIYEAPAMTLGQATLAGDPTGYELDMQASWYPPGESPATAGVAEPATGPRAAAIAGSAAARRLGGGREPIGVAAHTENSLDEAVFAVCAASGGAGALCRSVAAFGG